MAQQCTHIDTICNVRPNTPGFGFIYACVYTAAELAGFSVATGYLSQAP